MSSCSFIWMIKIHLKSCLIRGVTTITAICFTIFLPSCRLSERNPQDRLESELYQAAKFGHTSLATSLLSRGAQGRWRDGDQNTPLLLAALKGHWELVEKILEHAPQLISQKSGDGNSLLHMAATQGKTIAVLDLLKRGLSIDVRNHTQSTPLHLAVFSGQLETVKLLIQKKASLEAQNAYGETPLLVAAWMGRLKDIEILVAAGARLDAQTRNGETLQDYATKQNHLVIVKKYPRKTEKKLVSTTPRIQ